ncbi:HK97 family phage prohead protease [Variovorax ginsengisoli]|uniref:HK97 family phage prohead protease n=1 Tax=Variovorax ginsengisoli TaxID=363844 RepID=A0ABT8S8U9_9BURK|nr:HK97 family phage prohead protease [Variovorax ginsengisoli]MDN8615492.1 HK97 family phage prohead protease [Variovorax ginsengisoli]MDO1534662.1 HK97 family phage prohead protease [Variovorax ginsengisoli]
MIVEKRLTLAASGVTKFISSGKRKVRGYASTASVDRVGDVVLPRGGTWTLPLPLLLQHVHSDPIGLVRSIEVRGDGLWIEAELVEGIGKADEAWAMIEAGLLGAFSIGFQALKSEPLPTGGLKFVSWSLYEISVVTIPAQPEARIQRSTDGAVKLISAGIPLISARQKP